MATALCFDVSRIGQEKQQEPEGHWLQVSFFLLIVLAILVKDSAFLAFGVLGLALAQFERESQTIPDPTRAGVMVQGAEGLERQECGGDCVLPSWASSNTDSGAECPPNNPAHSSLSS